MNARGGPMFSTFSRARPCPDDELVLLKLLLLLPLANDDVDAPRTCVEPEPEPEPGLGLGLGTLPAEVGDALPKPEDEAWRRKEKDEPAALLSVDVALSSDALEAREIDCMRFRMDGRRVGLLRRCGSACFLLDVVVGLELEPAPGEEGGDGDAPALEGADVLSMGELTDDCGAVQGSVSIVAMQIGILDE